MISEALRDSAVEADTEPGQDSQAVAAGSRTWCSKTRVRRAKCRSSGF